MTMEGELGNASVRGVPLVFISTSDQIDCLQRVVGKLSATGNGTPRAVLVQDSCRGLSAIGREGEGVLAAMLRDTDAIMYTDAQTALGAARALPNRSVLICLGADRWMSEPRPAMAALLLRDEFKERGSMLVCIGTAYATASELGADVLSISDPPPDRDARKGIIEQVGRDAKIKASEQEIDGLLTYTRGLSAFATEQTCALAATREGFVLSTAERVWREQINATPGLRVLSERPSPESVAGLAGWTKHIERLARGRRSPEAIVFVDEIEKSLAGASGSVSDSSGSSQQVLGRMLSEMEGSGAEGAIFLGPPGTGKTLAATAAGAALGVPTILFNPSDCKGSLVGETERNATRALSVLRALAGRAYWISTCNGISSLPPELLRRFTDGVWFFDLPGPDERMAIWDVHLKSYSLDDKPYEHDEGWTGSDIRNVVRSAWNSNSSIEEISRCHVPSSRASAEMVEKLRRAAASNYRSAQYEGPYRAPETTRTGVVAQGRSFDL